MQWPIDPRVTPVRYDSQRQSSAVSGEGAKGNGFNPINSLTNPNGSQRSAPDGDGISREFVKPVTLGVRKSGGQTGEESPAPVTHSLSTPTPATVDISANLASLARMTALYYSRFVSGEQRGSVFTFDGGSLGNVQLTFQESDAGTTLHILVESLGVRQVLQRALPSLEQEWTYQGLNFSDVSVEVGDTGREGVFPGQGDLVRTPAIDSVVTEEVSIDVESESLRDYGYNTVEFVA
ncbi:MAG: flagellar hook-length control protein FliK [Fidelibacterota bacterium]|nr:MAG: flagellar hook-length control protein FliK [Candidatus Neomarinimicrobiota bacterium]